MRFVTLIEHQTPGVRVLVALVALTLLGTLDYFTGQGLSVSLLYSFLACVVAWFGSRRFSLLFAGLCAFSWWWANKDVHPYAGAWGDMWATASRLVSFLFVAIGSSALKTRQQADRQRIQALERAKALESEITRISEHEQRRIGQDLHDGICQTLAAIRCAASSLRDQMQLETLPQAGLVGEIADMLRDAIMETCSLVRGIFPVQMEAAGLPAVLDELAETTARLHGLEVSFEAKGGVQVPDPEAAMHLYRIAQEALGNAVRHSKARRISIRLAQEEGMLTLVVADDGGGMPPSLKKG